MARTWKVRRIALVWLLVILQGIGCKQTTDIPVPVKEVSAETPHPTPVPAPLDLTPFNKLVTAMANQQPIQRDQFHSSEEFEQRFQKATGMTWQAALALAAQVEADAAKAAQLKLPDTARLQAKLDELANKMGSFIDTTQQQIKDTQAALLAFKARLTGCRDSLNTLLEKSAVIAKAVREIGDELATVSSAADPKTALDKWFTTSVIQKLETAQIGAMHTYSAKFVKEYEEMRAELEALQEKLVDLGKATNTPTLIDEGNKLKKDTDDFSVKAVALAGAAVQIIAAASTLGPWGVVAVLVIVALLAIFSGKLGGGGGSSDSSGKGGKGAGTGKGNGQGAGEGDKKEGAGDEGDNDGRGQNGDGDGAQIPGPNGSEPIGGMSSAGPHRWRPFVDGTKVTLVIAGYNTQNKDLHAHVEFDSASDGLGEAHAALSSGAASLTINSPIAADGTITYPLEFEIEHRGAKFGCQQTQRKAPVLITKG